MLILNKFTTFYWDTNWMSCVGWGGKGCLGMTEVIFWLKINLSFYMQGVEARLEWEVTDMTAGGARQLHPSRSRGKHAALQQGAASSRVKAVFVKYLE